LLSVRPCAHATTEQRAERQRWQKKRSGFHGEG
jgi:hypothetical protein